MPDSDTDVSELAQQVVDELDPGSVIDNKVVLSRRQLVAIAGSGLGAGALATLGVGDAEAQSAAGQIGTSSEPVDVEGAQGTFQALEADAANIGGTPAGISLDQSTFEDITEHTGQLVEVADGDIETIFSVSDPVDVIFGKINGERIGRLKVTWADDSTDDIYIGSTQGRGAGDKTFNTISIGSIKNVKELSFEPVATNDYGWRVLTV